MRVRLSAYWAIAVFQDMNWIIFVVLLLFYVLGLFVFHASGPIHVLPFVAIAVLLVDRMLRRKYSC
jgi:hypothetical protein